MEVEDNFQFNYQKILSFLSRKNQRGYIFARADDYRLIASINKNLVNDLDERGVDAAIIFLKEESDTPLVTQIEDASKDSGALIVANLYSIVNKPETGLDNLIRINFARELFWELEKPILFWADAQSMHTISNTAIDLFSQRRHATVHFTGTLSLPVAPKFQDEALRPFFASDKFQDIEANIAILERRLKDAPDAGYPLNRIRFEIALPLAKQYAEINLPDGAKKILDTYIPQEDTLDDPATLAEIARVYYLMHNYERAIGSLEKANHVIADKEKAAGNKNVENNINWFNNLVDLVDWSVEFGKPNRFLNELQAIAASGNLAQRQYSLIYDRLGGIMMVIGNLPMAVEHYKHGLKIAQQLLRANPLSEQLQRDLSVSYEKLGDVQRSLGNLEQAGRHFEDSLKIRKQLVGANPLSGELQRDLSISYDKLGDIQQFLGNVEQAGKYFEADLKIVLQLVRANPLSEQLQRDLSVTYNKLGDVQQELGNLEQAEMYFDDSLKIRKQLASTNPLSEQLQRDLSISYNKLGDVQQFLGNYEQAGRYFEDGLKIREQLVRANPLSEQLQRDLSVSYNNLGGIAAERKTAVAYFEQALAIVKKLSAANPLSEQLKNDLLYYEKKLKDLNANDAL
jgi:tetratricopeptide (TPR) repeat protein